MKKNISKLNQIRLILGLQAKFETATLIDGVTTVEADAFAVGATLYVVDAAGNKTNAPAGTHETADLTITVDEAGVITSIVPKLKEDIVTEPVAVAAQEEGMPAEGMVPKEAIAEIVSEIVETKIEEGFKKKFEDIVDEEMTKVKMAIEEVAKTIDEVKTEMGAMKEKYSKFSKEPAGEPVRKAPNALYESFDALEDKVNKLAKFKAEFGKQK